MLRSWAASGEGCGGARVERGERYSRKEEEIVSGSTRWLGLNLRAWGGFSITVIVVQAHERTSGLGVDSVWMNIVRLACCVLAIGALGLHCCTRGLCCSGEDVMGDALWCRHRVAVRGVCDRSEGVARVTARSTDREIVGVAIVC